jgi:hypothetical protein
MTVWQKRYFNWTCFFLGPLFHDKRHKLICHEILCICLYHAIALVLGWSHICINTRFRLPLDKIVLITLLLCIGRLTCDWFLFNIDACLYDFFFLVSNRLLLCHLNADSIVSVQTHVDCLHLYVLGYSLPSTQIRIDDCLESDWTVCDTGHLFLQQFSKSLLVDDRFTGLEQNDDKRLE